MVLLAAGLSLLLFSLFLNTDRLHISGNWRSLNDQVGYVSVARSLVRDGVLESQIIYPSIEGQGASRNYPYMPGHYVLLALSILLLGDQLWAFLLPSLIAFLLTALCVYAVGAMLYGRAVGLLGSLIYCSFPFHPAFAFTAMMESTFALACLGVTLLFLWTPRRLQLLVGPLLLVVPFLFRETAVFLLPLMLLVGLHGRRRRWLPGVGACCLALALLGSVHALDFSAGRGSLLLANVFGAYDQVYRDAFWAPGPLSAADWVKAIGHKLTTNVGSLWRAPLEKGASLDYVGIVSVLLATAVCLIEGIRRRRIDPFPLAVALAMSLVGAMLFLVYSPFGFRGLRHMMFTLPLAAVVIARVLCEPSGRRRWRAAVAAALLVGSICSFPVVAAEMMLEDAKDDVRLALAESLHHDPDRLFIAPYDLGLPYVHRHPRVRWSFVPANDQTLALLHGRYRVGTVVLYRHQLDRQISQHALRRAGLRQVAAWGEGKSAVVVYQTLERAASP